GTGDGRGGRLGAGRTVAVVEDVAAAGGQVDVVGGGDGDDGDVAGGAGEADVVARAAGDQRGQGQAVGFQDELAAGAGGDAQRVDARLDGVAGGDARRAEAGRRDDGDDVAGDVGGGVGAQHGAGKQGEVDVTRGTGFQVQVGQPAGLLEVLVAVGG